MKVSKRQILFINLLRGAGSFIVGVLTTAIIFANSCYPAFISFVFNETNHNGFFRLVGTLLWMIVLTAYCTSVAWCIAYIIFIDQLSFGE